MKVCVTNPDCLNPHPLVLPVGRSERKLGILSLAVVDEIVSVLRENHMLFVKLEHLCFIDQLLTTAQI